MTRLTNDEMADRIVRSLKTNGSELAREQRSAENARVRQIGFLCIVFVIGIVAGAALILAL